MYRSLVQLALVSSVIAAAFFAACGEQPPPPGNEVLQLSANPVSIASNGATSTITVTAKDADGGTGTGTVNLTAAAGSLGGAGATAALPLNASGTATVTFACNRATDTACNTASVRIDGSWATAGKTVTSFTNITLTGGGGGGADGGDGGSGGSDGGGGGGSLGVFLSGSRTTLYAGLNDAVDVLARATAQADGGGGPRAGLALDFSTTGTASVQLGPAQDGGSKGSTYSATTDGSGNAVVRLYDNGSSSSRTGTLTARDPASGASGSLNFTVAGIQLVAWVSTKCTTPQGQVVDCTLLGIKNSGYQEQAQVTFRVMDTQSTPQPVPGVSVSFVILNGPNGILVTPTVVTGANGQATATVISGPGTGTFVVRGSVGTTFGDSPTLAVRGAKASNKGFSFDCVTVNLAAYVANQPPNPLTDVCTVKLVDRFGNPVGTGAAVNFKTEAGSITNSVSTQPFNTMVGADNSKEGYGTVTFDTRGVYPPAETAPLAAAPGQWPFPRVAEPQLTVGAGVIRNPRDGLVTVVAYLKGEEYYDDNNTNGQWDPGEPYLDQGEAFVDSDDNGVWDPGELYVDDSPANGIWDGPNSVWDGNTTISVDLRLLYSGRPIGDPQHSALIPASFGTCAGNNGIPKGAPRTYFDAYFGDQNLNRSIAGTSFRAFLLPTGKGTSGWFTGSYLDGYGFGIDRQRLDATTSQACSPSTSTRCIWRTLFYDWGGGYAGQAYIDTVPATDMTPCVDVQLNVGSTVLSVETLTTAQGALK